MPLERTTPPASSRRGGPPPKASLFNRSICARYGGGIIVFVLMMSVFYVATQLVMPWYCEHVSPSSFWPLWCLAIYELFVVFTNWIFFWLRSGVICGVSKTNRYVEVSPNDPDDDETTADGKDATTTSVDCSSDDWCSSCEQKGTPARAHHCPLCGFCVMKRDHHCFFLGSCVGMRNERYFLCFTLHVALASAISLYFLVQYLYFLHPNFFTMRSFIAFMPPVSIAFALIGTSSWALYALTMALTIHLAGLFGAGGFFCFQMYIVLRGQTSYEWARGYRPFPHRTRMQNLKSVMGPYWALQFFCPTFIDNVGAGGEYSWLKVKSKI